MSLSQNVCLRYMQVKLILVLAWKIQYLSSPLYSRLGVNKFGFLYPDTDSNTSTWDIKYRVKITTSVHQCPVFTILNRIRSYVKQHKWMNVTDSGNTGFYDSEEKNLYLMWVGHVRPLPDPLYKVQCWHPFDPYSRQYFLCVVYFAALQNSTNSVSLLLRWRTVDEFPSFKLRRGICWMREHISPSWGTLLHFIRDKIHHSKQTREPCKSHWRKFLHYPQHCLSHTHKHTHTHTNAHTLTHTHIQTQLMCKRHKANKSWESWIRRERGTSRTVILCDCSLLCASKWRITVSVVRMAAGCLKLNRRVSSHWTMELFLLQRPRSQRGRACGSRACSPGQRSSALSEWKNTRGSILEMAVTFQLWP